MPTIPTEDTLSRIKIFLDKFEEIDAEIEAIYKVYKTYYRDTNSKDEKMALYLRFKEKSELRMAAINKAQALIEEFEQLEQETQLMCMRPLLLTLPEGLGDLEKDKYKSFTEISDTNTRIIRTINRLESYFHSKEKKWEGQGLFDVTYTSLEDYSHETEQEQKAEHIRYDKQAACIQLKFEQMKSMARKQILDENRSEVMFPLDYTSYLGELEASEEAKSKDSLSKTRRDHRHIIRSFLDKDAKKTLGSTSRKYNISHLIRSLQDDTLVIDRRLAMAIKDENNALAYDENGSQKRHPIDFQDGHTRVQLTVNNEPYWISPENPLLDQDLLTALVKTNIINPNIQYFDYSTASTDGAQCPIDITLLQSCENLKRLNLGYRGSNFSGSSNEKLLDVLCGDEIKPYRNIEDLDLSGRSFTIEKIIDICKKFPNIKSLSLDNCMYVRDSDSFFPDLFEKCPNLKNLSLKDTGHVETSRKFIGLNERILRTIPLEVLKKAKLDRRTTGIRDSIISETKNTRPNSP